MKNILIYTTNTCPFCTMAKKLLQEKGLTYTEIRVDDNEAERQKMIEQSGRRTVPQIFMEGEHIGGYDDLYAHFKKMES